MIRLAALVLALALAGSAAPAAQPAAARDVVAPAAAPAPASAPAQAPAELLPPVSSAMAPAVAPQAAPAALKRLGVLRIPAIGIYVNVYNWGCGASIVPNVALRWVCKSSNNMFIVGHGYGVFRPYLVAFTLKRLRVGIIATFTTPAGKTTRYKMAWTRKVLPSYLWSGLTGPEWAWGNTPLPSLTLQTCWGATNAYRIVTRFVRG